jgi:acylglycerol lipase
MAGSRRDSSPRCPRPWASHCSAATASTPLLFLLGGDDRIVDTESHPPLRPLHPAADVTIEVYPGHYHELLNELDRATILPGVRDWIMARA